MTVNKVILIGNLGRDPELRYTAKQTPVCSLSVATTEKTKDQQGNWVDHTEWHRVSAFGKTAEVCANHLVKGSRIYLEGKLRTNKWQDKTTGTDKYSTEILMDTFQFLSPKSETARGSAGGGMNYSNDNRPAAVPMPDLPSADDLAGVNDEPISLREDDIPF